MPFKESDIHEAIATIYTKLCEGKTDKEIMHEMGLEADEFVAFKTAMMDAKIDELRTMPEEHMYVRYMIEQNINIKDLTQMINQFKSTKQYNALVGAVRARSEILDKIIAKGQEFGIIKKTPSRKEVVAGVLVADMTNNDLRTGITQAIKQLDQLVKMYGNNKTILELPEPDSFHHGPKLPPETLSTQLDKPPKKTAKNTKKKVFKGRRKKMPPPVIDA